MRGKNLRSNNHIKWKTLANGKKTEIQIQWKQQTDEIIWEIHHVVG